MASTPTTTLEAAGQTLGLGLVAAIGHLAVRTHLFSGPEGGAALTDLVGCLATTLTLFAVLGVRALSTGSTWQQEVRVGAWAVAAMAWCFALAPPRPEGYAPNAAFDEFTFIDAPVSLVLGLVGRFFWVSQVDVVRVALRRWALLVAVGLTAKGLLLVGWTHGLPSAAMWAWVAAAPWALAAFFWPVKADPAAPRNH